MPRGRKVDQEQALAKLREVRRAMTQENKSISEARREAGVSSSNYSRWQKVFGHLLEPAQPKAGRRVSRSLFLPVSVPAQVVRRRKHARNHQTVARGPLPPAVFAAAQQALDGEEVQDLRDLVVEQALTISRLLKAQHHGSK